MTDLQWFAVACMVALLVVRGIGGSVLRASAPSTFAGILIGLAISFVGLRPWVTQFGFGLSIHLFVGFIAAAVGWTLVRSQVRITSQHLWWLALMGTAFLLSFRAAPEIPRGVLLVAVAVVATLFMRVSATGVMTGLLLAAYSMLAAAVWFSHVAVGPRLSILGENPIWIARVGVLGMLACLFLFATWRVRLLVAAPLLAAILLTEARGPLLALVAGVLVYAVARSRRPELPLIGMGILVVATLFPTHTISDPYFGGTGRIDSVTDRLYSWKVAADIWLGSPLVGIGQPIDPVLLPGIAYPHNSIADLLVQTGLAGLAIVVIATLIAVRQPAVLPLRVALVTAAWFSLTSGTVWSNWEMWMLMGLTLASRQSSPRPKREGRSDSRLHPAGWGGEIE